MNDLTGYPMTFLELFRSSNGGPAITAIEIPMIQRDFAQGREDQETQGIRARFLDVLISAATGAEGPAALDFIYGEVKDGVLRPLDGQQRLTTLYLLHWYVASRAGGIEPSAAWLAFSYATRPTARDFCETIAQNPLPNGVAKPSEWIIDQPWYVYPWRQDPTIASMLVVLDAIHSRLDGAAADFTEVWDRLADQSQRAISFLFLPILDMDYGEDLYIKMNSRGKPLTDFEIFKSDIQGILKPLLSTHSFEELTRKIDGTWADLLWEYERTSGGDFVVDNEFMSYLAFILDVCEWRDDAPDRRWHDKSEGRTRSLEDRARLAFTDSESPNAEWNREFFFHAFDTWQGTMPAKYFEELFVTNGPGHGAIPLFASPESDLLGSCLARYGGREFSLTETLLLFAVLINREPGTAITDEQRNRRLRTLRNLAETAVIDRNRMSEYIAATEQLMRTGSLEGARAFNQEWMTDEKRKWAFVDAYPDLAAAVRALEDNDITRGRLLAFELDRASLEPRAVAFTAASDPDLRDSLGAALLTKGDYSRSVQPHGNTRQLGSSRGDPWRALLSTGPRIERMKRPLMDLLDDLAARMQSGATADQALISIRESWLQSRVDQSGFDWRYYLVRYGGARSWTGHGYYTGSYSPERGFSYDRFRILHGTDYKAYFSDAILRAAWVEGPLEETVKEPSWWRRDNPGMALIRSGIEIRSREDGFDIIIPFEDASLTSIAKSAVGTRLAPDGLWVPVRQLEHDGHFVDAEDRVLVAIATARDLTNAGL